jgi:hypothetical protein
MRDTKQVQGKITLEIVTVMNLATYDVGYICNIYLKFEVDSLRNIEVQVKHILYCTKHINQKCHFNSIVRRKALHMSRVMTKPT